MHITIRTYWGPNPFSRRPCIIFRFEEMTDKDLSIMAMASGKVAGYLESKYGYPHSGNRNRTAGCHDVFDFLSNASLFMLNYVRGDLDESGCLTDSGIPVLFVEFHRPELTVKAVKILLDMVSEFSCARMPELDAILNDFWNECQKAHPDFQAHTLIAAAKTRKTLYAHLGNKLWLYGMGVNSQVFFETSTIEDMKSCPEMDKLSGKEIFRAVGAPTARYRIVTSRSGLLPAIDDIGFPCAIKPVHSGAGKGVTANIRTLDEVAFAYLEACRFAKKDNAVMVEEYVPGRDYRLLFARGKFVGCASSVAPSVTGDGIRSIRELIESINAGRTRNLYGSNYLRPVRIDQGVIETLSVQGLGLDSVLQPGAKVTLRRNTNLGGGGLSDAFDTVHPEILAIAEKIAGHSGLHSVGIDYITEDISASPSLSGGKFTELNKTPGAPLLLAAGYDITGLGNRILGDGVDNIAVTLSILRNDDYQEYLKSYRGEYALFLPDTVAGQGRVSKFENRTFRQLLYKVFSDKNLKCLEIVAQPEFLEASGFPTEYLTRIIVGKSCRTKMISDTIEKLDCPVHYA
ncbi:MAG: ATP-grasp domain-containing protein [Chlorobi bacterium]|nr:ATP-grasp domain-containing protein [Chlorobiota bacterium]